MEFAVKSSGHENSGGGAPHHISNSASLYYCDLSVCYFKSCIQCLEYGMFSNRLSYYRQGSFESVSVTLTPGCIVSFFGFLRKCQCMYVRRCKWCTVAIDDYLTDRL